MDKGQNTSCFVFVQKQNIPWFTWFTWGEMDLDFTMLADLLPKTNVRWN